MKKLLSILAVFTLVGISATNLKSMFTNTITNYDFKLNQTNNKDIHKIMKELFIDKQQEKNEVMEIIKRKDLIVAYHGDHPNGAGVCTDGIAAALMIKIINPTAITFVHSHYDALASIKISKIISNNYKLNKIVTIMFSDTTISKNNFEDFLFYLAEMIPQEVEEKQELKLNIIFQDHHLEPMKKVITQISYFNYKNVDNLQEKLTVKGKENFKRIQYLINSKKLSFTKITSNNCENNKQPSSELLFEIINPLIKLNIEQLFFISSCILSEKVSIFPSNNKSLKQAFEDFKSFIKNKFKFVLDDNEIIDLLDLIDSELKNLAKEIDLNFPFTCIVDKKYFFSSYSTTLMYKLINTNLLTNLYNCVKEKNIAISQKRKEIENSKDDLILLHIKNKKYFVVTPFPRQGSTRSITLIMQKVRDIIQKQEDIEIESFLLPNFSSVVSVIPYNKDIYFRLNDVTSFEKKSIPFLNFIAVGHKNSFVLKSTDSQKNFSSDLKKYLETNKEQFKKIKGISYFLN